MSPINLVPNPLFKLKVLGFTRLRTQSKQPAISAREITKTLSTSPRSSVPIFPPDSLISQLNKTTNISTINNEVCNRARYAEFGQGVAKVVTFVYKHMD